MHIKDFQKFQHFKDRRPPWIKLYREILDDAEWFDLDPKDAKILVMLWLIASEDKTMKGNLPGLKQLSFRLRMSETDVKATCFRLSHWVGQTDISTISEDHQTDAPETETETETEGDGQKKSSAKPPRFNPLSLPLPECVSADMWGKWISYRRSRKLTCNQDTIEGQLKNLTLWANAGHSAEAIICTTIDNGWQGLFEPKTQPKPQQVLLPDGKAPLPDFMRGAI